MVHIPCKGGAPAIQAAVAGDAQITYGTPADIGKKQFNATQGVMQRADVKAALGREGTEVALSKSLADFASFLAEDNRFWAKLVKDAGVRAD